MCIIKCRQLHILQLRINNEKHFVKQILECYFIWQYTFLHPPAFLFDYLSYAEHD